MALSSVWANLPQRTAGRPRLYAALARPFRRRRRACLRLHAGARKGAVDLAGRRAVVDGAGVRRGTAAGRFLDRPHAARPFAGTCRKPARDAEGDLARAVAGRPRRHRRAQPARRLGALRAHAVRHRPAVFARPAQRAAARDQFHAGRLGRRAVLPAVEAALDDALPQPPRTQRPPPLADLFRRHRRRGAEAALSGPAGRAARLAPRLRAGAVAAGRDAEPFGAPADGVEAASPD